MCKRNLLICIKSLNEQEHYILPDSLRCRTWTGSAVKINLYFLSVSAVKKIEID